MAKIKVMKKATIGIFTASTPIGSLFPKRLEKAISFLEEKGHLVVKGNLICKSDDYRSGSISDRVKEINDLLDKDVDILLAAIGGMNSSSLLSLLPYDKINSKRIIVCGFSDTTAILNAVIKKAPNARAIYSPSLMPNFGENEKESQNISYDFLSKIINQDSIELKPLDFIYSSKEEWNSFEEGKLIKLRLVNKSEWKVINNNFQDFVEGILFGGNGSTLSGLLGSEYVVAFPKHGILFLEDAEKDAPEVERIFSNFLNHGIFKKAKAIILGKYDQYRGIKQPWEILKEILTVNNIEVPIIYDVDVSHSKPMLALELNKLTKIDFQEKIISQSLNQLNSQNKL